MRKYCIYVIVLVYVVTLHVRPVSAQFNSSYDYYLSLAEESIQKRDYQTAFFYLETAHMANPSRGKPLELMQQIPAFDSYVRSYQHYFDRAIEAVLDRNFDSALFYLGVAQMIDPDRVEPDDHRRLIEMVLNDRLRFEDAFANYIEAKQQEEVPQVIPMEEPIQETVEIVEEEPVIIEEVVIDEPAPIVPVDVVEEQPKPAPKSRIALERLEAPKEKATVRPRAVTEEDIEQAESIRLNQALWTLQPGTQLDVEFKKVIVLEGQNIERFLNLNEELIGVKRIDRNRLVIVGKRRGSSIVHIWDDTGRWTFNVNVILPFVEAAKKIKRKDELKEEHVDSFKFTYSNNWSSFYLGDSFNSLDRQNLTYRQWLGFYGPTPYGELAGGVTFNKFDQSTELIEQTLGLYEGKIGPFKDFTIIGWDTSKRFSAFSLPGRNFRGFLINAYAFHRRLKYTYLTGQDRVAFNFSNPNEVVVRKSYLEGAKVTLYPDGPHSYSLNWARGHGEARSNSLKDKVFSIDTRHRHKNWYAETEIAYDDEDYAKRAMAKLEAEYHRFAVSFRDIDKNFQTITSRPSGQGEIGGKISYDWTPGDLRISTDLDVYQDRQFFNPEERDSVNFDFNSSLSYAFDDTTRLLSSFYYADTSQLISPRESLRLSNTLSKTFKWLNDRTISMSFGGTYQRNRYDFSPSSEYDRYSMRASFRLPVLRQLSYFANYEYSWVDEALTGDTSTPSVFNTGLSYSTKITDDWSSRLSLTYRNEENTDDSFSFLSGQDYLRGNVNLTYRPNSDYEFFVDGTVRNVWAEGSDRTAFNEADIRFGVRTTWDLFFRWDPKGTIYGYVFKDIDGDKFKGSSEPGLANVKINIGNKTAITNEEGYYALNIRADKALVQLDTASLPKGYVIASDTERKVDIEHLDDYQMNFALTVRTGIFGIVFLDENQNGTYELGEKTFPKVKVVLDQKFQTYTDFEGVYSFSNIKPGAHTVRVDVNSIPIDYLPVNKISTDIEVQEGSTYTLNVPLKRAK